MVQRNPVQDEPPAADTTGILIMILGPVPSDGARDRSPPPLRRFRSHSSKTERPRKL